MTAIILITACIILGEMLSPKRHNRYRRFGNRRNYYDPYSNHQDRMDEDEYEDELNRIAWRYTLIFVFLVALAMYLIHGLATPEVNVVTR
jgi:hypothetical protein